MVNTIVKKDISRPPRLFSQRHVHEPDAHRRAEQSPPPEREQQRDGRPPAVRVRQEAGDLARQRVQTAPRLRLPLLPGRAQGLCRVPQEGADSCQLHHHQGVC
jgi:hypothetical protein